jgi:hypothetical protein
MRPSATLTMNMRKTMMAMAFAKSIAIPMEGIWTELRNFLRPFRGVHKKYLATYVAMFEWAHNLKRVTTDFLRTLMLPDFTYLPTCAEIKETVAGRPAMPVGTAEFIVNGLRGQGQAAGGTGK